MPTPIDSALELAKTTLKNKGRTFYFAQFFLGRIHAERATRLYSICRYIDDAADESDSIRTAKTALLQVENDIKLKASAHLVVRDAIALIDECMIGTAPILSLIEGVSSDLGQVRLADEAELLRYCYQVAGTVGLMMSKILGTHSPNALPHAIDLGIAMQLTNICRDIKADALMQRCYLPATWVGTPGFNDLIDPATESQMQLRKVTAQLLALADQHYASGEQGLAYLPLGARSSILVASRVYRAIGKKLQKSNYAYWQSRTTVSTLSKVCVSLHALITMAFKPHFWKPQQAHHAQLHACLIGLAGINTKVKRNAESL